MNCTYSSYSIWIKKKSKFTKIIPITQDRFSKNNYKRTLFRLFYYKDLNLLFFL